MSIDFCGLKLAHPVINASGTFDLLAARSAFGAAALRADFPFAAFVSKTITLEPRVGNPPPRLWEAPAGLVNSIGLPNKGLEVHLAEELPALARLLAELSSAAPTPIDRRSGSGARRSVDARPRAPIPLITNVMGSTAAEIATLLERCDERAEIAALELNVSCPNVKTGLDIGADPAALEAVIRAVRPRTRKPLIVKLTPNTADVAACARAAEAGGANAVSLINTLRGMALAPVRAGPPREAPDATRASRGGPSATRAPHRVQGLTAPASGVRSASPWLGGGSGGLSGPAIRTVALAQVAAVAASVAIPVIGMGGVQSAAHARDLLDVGATLVAVGTESFRDPTAGACVARGLAESARPGFGPTHPEGLAG